MRKYILITIYALILLIGFTGQGMIGENIKIMLFKYLGDTWYILPTTLILIELTKDKNKKIGIPLFMIPIMFVQGVRDFVIGNELTGLTGLIINIVEKAFGFAVVIILLVVSVATGIALMFKEKKPVRKSGINIKLDKKVKMIDVDTPKKSEKKVEPVKVTKPANKKPVKEKTIKEKPTERKPLKVKPIKEKDVKPVKVVKKEKSVKEVKQKEVVIKELEPIVKVKRNSNYKFPSTKLFDEKVKHDTNLNKEQALISSKQIEEVLTTFDINAKVVNYHIGPTVTKYEIRPDSNIKVSRIQALQDNIKMELSAKDIRIEAPISGKNTVGIEIPNIEKETVKMIDFVKTIKNSNHPTEFALGKDLFGNLITCNLEKMPHLLIAGATGSGKSVCINTIITSYLTAADPSEVKLVLIDPKKVEFTPYNDIPHLLCPVITDTKMATLMLQRIVVMMEERYNLFSEAGARNIQTYNAKVDKFNEDPKDQPLMKRLPYIVVIVDELADLMLLAKKEVEGSIQRITQLARAAGIHLIVATQRPSVDVITGVIKSNIPSRISFAVATAIDSRTILDQAGAERLLGYGDMLYFPQGSSSATRVQGVYVSDDEIKHLTDFAKSQAKPEYDDAYFELLNNKPTISSSNDKDSMYDEAVEYVREVKKASTSLLQRRFGIGYNRAARIIDEMEENGIIGSQNGSKPREVY